MVGSFETAQTPRPDHQSGQINADEDLLLLKRQWITQAPELLCGLLLLAEGQVAIIFYPPAKNSAAKFSSVTISTACQIAHHMLKKDLTDFRPDITTE